MGTHAVGRAPAPLPPNAQLVQITFHAWRHADRTMISAVGVYEVDGETIRRNIGGDVLEYDAFSMPGIGQTVYCLGDEIRQAWRELSSPKA